MGKQGEKSWRWQSDSRMRELFGRGPGDLLCYMASRFRYFKRLRKLYEDQSFYMGQKQIAKELGCSLRTVRRESQQVREILLVAPAKGQFNYYGLNAEAWPDECRDLLDSGQIDRSSQVKMTGGSGQIDRHRNKKELRSSNKTTGQDFCSEDFMVRQVVHLIQSAARHHDLFQDLDADRVNDTLTKVCAPKLITRYRKDKPGLFFEQWVKVMVEAVVEYNIDQGNSLDDIPPHFFVSAVAFNHALPWWKKYLRDNVGKLEPTWSFWKKETVPEAQGNSLRDQVEGGSNG